MLNRTAVTFDSEYKITASEITSISENIKDIYNRNEIIEIRYRDGLKIYLNGIRIYINRILNQAIKNCKGWHFA
jgi:hypothetical protein